MFVRRIPILLALPLNSHQWRRSGALHAQYVKSVRTSTSLKRVEALFLEWCALVGVDQLAAVQKYLHRDIPDPPFHNAT